MQKSYITDPYDRWMWIELIGFDNQAPDFGVRAFLDRAGFTPQVISLLLFNPDFVHMHNGMDLDSVFPDDFCSYNGHERNEERLRQSWTQHQLRQLIKELQQNEIKVYLSFFDLVTGNQWSKQHPELWYIIKNGEAIEYICPWKRLADNTYYEDFFVNKLINVMKDYGFDGLHGADGYNQPRWPIYFGDLSDDMIEQFTSSATIVFPNEIQGKCDGYPNLISDRAAWIWNNKRLEYITFCTNRHQQFWRKVARAMHEIKKQVVVNSAWARDPFEAIYRYGTDYRKLVDAGVDGFVIEAASIALETQEQSKEPLRYLCDFMASNLLNKAYVPDVPLRWLHGIKDTQENWNALRQAPTALECEAHCMSNLYSWSDDGNLNRCMSGLVTCLSDGIAKDDWQRLKTIWDLGFSAKPEDIAGATVVWSDSALQNQLKDYIKTRHWHVQHILRHLIAMGASIQSVVRIGDIDKIGGPIVCINLHLWSEDERSKIFEYSNGPVIVIGEKASLSSQHDCLLEDINSPTQLACGVYGKQFDFDTTITPKADLKKIVTDVSKIIDPLTWMHDLFFTDVSEGFLTACVEAINKCVTGPKIVDIASGHGYDAIKNPKTVTVSTLIKEKNKWRLLIRNDNYICAKTKIDVGSKIANIEWMNPFTATRIIADGSIFNIKVPGRGIAIVDIEIQ